MTSPAATDQTGRRGLDPDQRSVLTALLALQRESWEQGVTGSALLDLAADDPGCAAAARAMALDAATRRSADGRLAGIGDDNAVNGASLGEVVRWAAAADPDSAVLAAGVAGQLYWLRTRCPRAGDGTLFHLRDRPEVWADTVFMVVPLLVLAGRLEEAERQLDGHRRRLFDAGSGLYAARFHESRGIRHDPRYWGTASGWVAAGIARALHHLGADRAGTDFRERAAGHARAVLDGCLALRRTDGLFGDVLDDPAGFAEVNLAQMLAYTAATGVADSWLPAGYRTVAVDLLATARGCVGATGLVRPACAAPDFDRPGFSAEAQAFFLLASSAVGRLG